MESLKLEQNGDTEITKSEEIRTDEKVPPILCSQRWILSLLFMWGFFFAYALRANFSVAIVCMVRTPLENATNLQSFINNLTNSEDDKCGALEFKNNSRFNQRGEFDWDKETKSSLLTAFFYGYAVTQIPGGWLADIFGGRRVYGLSLATAATATLLTPVCARTSIILLYILRIINGIAMGTCSPSASSMWGRWGPRLERTKLTATTSIGSMMGTVGTFAVSGVLCESGFDNGWGSIFYIFGGLTAIWVVLWFCLTSDTPSSHPRISDKEKKYIVKNVEYNANKRTGKVPWLDMLKSGPLWGLIIGHTCSNWGVYTCLTIIPEFMKSVLKYDIKSNGALSALPYVCGAVMSYIAALLADSLRSRRILSTTRTRHIFQGIAFIGPSIFLIATGFIGCEHRSIAVVLLCLAMLCTGCERAGYCCNHIDIAPKYGGLLYGITNTVASIPGMVAPLVAGLLTPNDTDEEWRNVFYVSAGFNVLGAIVFWALVKGEIQPWALDKKDLKEMKIFI